MSPCINKELGDRLYAYELGMLSEEENRAFELHLIECTYCSHRAQELADASRIIAHDTDIHSYVGSLTNKDADPDHEKKLQDIGRRWTRKSWTYAIPVAAVILIFLLLIDWEVDIRPKKEAAATENRLTILYFANVADASDPDHLSDVTTNLLITDLGESEYFQVTSGTRLQSILHILGIDKAQSREDDRPFEIARESRAKWVLSGEILKIEPEIIITSQLFSVATGDILASQRVAGKPGQDIFAVIDQLSEEIKDDLPLPALARKELDRSVAEITTHSPDAYRHFLSGVELKARFDLPRAIEEFKMALKYDSTMAMAFFHLAELEDPELIHKARKFSENLSRREKYHIEASYALISRHASEAIEWLQKLVADYPDDAYAYWRLGQIYNQRGQIDLAISNYEAAASADPCYRNAYNSLAYVYDEIGDLEQSILAINKYIEIAPGEPNPYDTRGDLYSRRGLLDQAIESYQKALGINPNFHVSLQKLGFCYLYRLDYKQADSCFRVLSEKGDEVDRMHARFMLVATHLRQGKFAYALSIIDSLVTANLWDGDFMNAAYHQSMKSQILVEIKQFEDAVACAEQSRELIPPDSQSLYLSHQSGFVQILAQAGDIKKARYELEVLKSRLEEAERPLEVVKARLEDVEMPMTDYWVAKGFVEFFDNDFDSAIDAFLADTGMASGFLTQYMLARAYFEKHQYDRAAEGFEAIIKDMNPERLQHAIKNVKVHYYLGRTFEESHWFEKAVEQYEIFLSLWKNADTNLEIITDAKERLTRLKRHL